MGRESRWSSVFERLVGARSYLQRMGSKRSRKKNGRALPGGHWRDGVDEPDDTSIYTHIRDTLRRESPMHFLVIVSLLMSVNDPRPTELFDRSKRSEGAPAARAKLIAELVASPLSEATALLAVLAEFLGDDGELATTIRTELARRPPLTPRWLARLGQTQIQRAVRASHALDDADCLLVQGRVPARRGDFTCLIRLGLDRLGGVDGVVVEGPIEHALTLIDWPAADIRSQDVELDDVRARVTSAIGWETHMPPRESETWPMHRALVEWLVRLLPEGGTSPSRDRSWTIPPWELLPGVLRLGTGPAIRATASHPARVAG